MFTFDTAKTINTIVDDVLCPGHIKDHEKRVMFITLRIEVFDLTKEGQFAVSYLHLMYFKGSGNVLFGSQVSEFESIPDYQEWTWQASNDLFRRHVVTQRLISDTFLKAKESVPSNILTNNIRVKAIIHHIQFHEVKAVETGVSMPIRLEF